MSMKMMSSGQLLKDVEQHSLTILRDDETYRHLMFLGPKPNSWNMWFEIITWPGVLTINGDMGTWSFARVPDMFRFFRQGKSGEPKINEQYWAEKILSEDRRTGPYKKFVAEVYREHVIASLDNYSLTEEKKIDITAALNEMFDETEECESEMRRAVREFKYGDNGEYPRKSDFEFSDPWEIDGEVYTYHYLWCLYAIVWAIQQYDAEKEKVKRS